MEIETVYYLLSAISVFGLVACAVAYIFALCIPEVERHFRRVAQGVTSVIGLILILALLLVLRS